MKSVAKYICIYTRFHYSLYLTSDNISLLPQELVTSLITFYGIQIDRGRQKAKLTCKCGVRSEILLDRSRVAIFKLFYKWIKKREFTVCDLLGT